MSNAELRLKNEEVEKYKCTKYEVWSRILFPACYLPACGRQDTNYLPAAAGNAERRLKNNEVKIRIRN
jgi:hypothetical protein